MLKRTVSTAVAMLVLAAAMILANAADYPSRPITLVVGFPPGGASDILARIVANKLSSLLGQPFVIDNRPGAGGNVAGEVVAHAAPDGYTLLLGNNAILATNASLYKKIGFDAEKDFAPITLIGTQANVLVVNLDLPAHSLAELIALAKAQAGQAQLRLFGLWPGGASRRRIVQDRGPHRHRPRSLQGFGAGAAGRHRRAGPDDVRHDVRCDGRHQGRAGAAARGNDAQTHCRACPISRPSMSSA